MGLGSVKLVSLKNAREQAAKYRHVAPYWGRPYCGEKKKFDRYANFFRSREYRTLSGDLEK